MEFLWVDLCFLLSPFTALTGGKWLKKANLSWFESRQHTSGRGPMQTEQQGLSSGGTTLHGQSTAKNIQMGLRDTEEEKLGREQGEHVSPAAVYHNKSGLGILIYKYIHLYSGCINVYVNLYLDTWANATQNSTLRKCVSNPLFINQTYNMLKDWSLICLKRPVFFITPSGGIRLSPFPILQFVDWSHAEFSTLLVPGEKSAMPKVIAFLFLRSGPRLTLLQTSTNTALISWQSPSIWWVKSSVWEIGFFKESWRMYPANRKCAAFTCHLSQREHIVLNAEEELNQLQEKFALLSINKTNGVCLCSTFHSEWSSALLALIISPITELQTPLGWNINSCSVEHSSKTEQFNGGKTPRPTAGAKGILLSGM